MKFMGWIPAFIPDLTRCYCGHGKDEHGDGYGCSDPGCRFCGHCQGFSPELGPKGEREYQDIFGINADGTEDKNDLYLRRYYIYRGKRRPHIYLHHIVRSDFERACHDHPWDFVSLILKTGYTEICQFPETAFSEAGTTRTWKRPGTFIRHKATDLHRLELKAPAWSLVFSGKKKRLWGFQTSDKGWIAFDKLYAYIRDMMD